MIRRVAQIRVGGDGLSVIIPRDWSLGEGTGDRQRVTLVFGGATAQAQLVEMDGTGAMTVSTSVARALRLHQGLRLQVRYDASSHTLTLGPILGVFTVRRPIYGSKKPGPYGSRANLYRPLIRLAEQRGMLVYLFSPQDVDWQNKTVVGYTYHGGKWSFARYPLPDVVYDRIPSRRDEKRNEVIQAKELLQRECHYFNPSYLNKWEVHSLLARRTESKVYLPETRLLSSLNELAYFVNKYDEVYLKPTMSSVGRGIMKITKSNGGYILHRRLRRTMTRSFYRSISQLYTAITPQRSKSAYLIQQGIDLATFHGRHFDIRALAQKNGAGRWEVTGMAARVAAQGAIVTHVPNGGARQRLRSVIPAERFASVQQQLLDAGRLLPKVLEEEMGKVFGEVSLDLAVDRNGKVWMIEANAKPFEFDEPAIRQIARKKLLDYACYLDESR